MRDTVIRGKAVSFVLFVMMICLGVYFQKQESAAGIQTAKPQTLNQEAARQASEQAADAQLVRKAADLPKQVALTFDDGPHPAYTKILLDGLRERGVKATFFVVGECIPGNEEIVRQMEEDGHIIGNHTYDHVDISSLSREDACTQLQKTSNLVEEITGKPTAYVRAPFGKWNDGLDTCVSMIQVRWTVDPLDWTTNNQAQIVNRVVTEADDNDIILLHDYYESSVNAALEIVDILKKEGFEFVTVEQLLLE